jgi:phenylalanyl-tRNA synthetase beta subunit
MLVDDQKGNPRLTYRQSLFHSLIDYERGRQHIRLPHRIFEIGLVSAMEGFRTHLALIAVDQKLDINELYFVLYHAMDVTYDQRISLAHGSDNRFEDGGFEIISCDGQVMGILGVVSKDVAKTYRQRFKTGFAELSLPNT